MVRGPTGDGFKDAGPWHPWPSDELKAIWEEGAMDEPKVECMKCQRKVGMERVTIRIFPAVGDVAICDWCRADEISEHGRLVRCGPEMRSKPLGEET